MCLDQCRLCLEMSSDGKRRDVDLGCIVIVNINVVMSALVLLLFSEHSVS